MLVIKIEKNVREIVLDIPIRHVNLYRAVYDSALIKFSLGVAKNSNSDAT